MTTTEKARIAAEIKAFRNTDFSDCPELTDEQIAQLKPSRFRNMANYKPFAHHLFSFRIYVLL